MRNFYLALSFLSMVLVNISFCLADNASDEKRISGTIVRIEQVATTRSGNADQGIEQMGMMYGLLGALIANVLSIEQLGYNLYYIKAADGPEFEVASRKDFSAGDCVLVSFPEFMGDRPHVGIDADVRIAKSSGCPPAPLVVQLLENSALEVMTPKGSAWQLIEKKPGAIAFARRGEASSETFSASIQAFTLPPTKDNDELLSVIRGSVEKDSPSERFTMLKESFDIDESRGYTCVRFNGVIEDKQAKTGWFSQETLTLQLSSLYCRHPQQQTTGFVIAYSHRGEATYSSLDVEAEEFMQGVKLQAK